LIYIEEKFPLSIPSEE